MSKRKLQPVVVTTWIERFSQAISMMCCGRIPPADLVLKWVDGVEDNQATLQDWIFGEGKPCLAWAQAIAILDAAQILADSPEEGYGHFDKNGDSHGY